MREINASGISFTELNRSIRDMLGKGKGSVRLKNVTGQRYIADGISGTCRLLIEGVPGNDMAAYMDGPEVVVYGNSQDSTANTMNSGRIIIYGNAGDTAGYAMRGGEIFIKGDTGYRTGIHMKEYKGKKPVIVIGGRAGDFLGEYMAGGVIILLGIGAGKEAGTGSITGNYCGTGMHGGVIYVRGEVEGFRLGKEVRAEEAGVADMKLISGYVARYAKYFDVEAGIIADMKFTKIYSFNKRPYGNLYAY